MIIFFYCLLLLDKCIPAPFLPTSMHLNHLAANDLSPLRQLKGRRRAVPRERYTQPIVCRIHGNATVLIHSIAALIGPFSTPSSTRTSTISTIASTRIRLHQYDRAKLRRLTFPFEKENTIRRTRPTTGIRNSRPYPKYAHGLIGRSSAGSSGSGCGRNQSPQNAFYINLGLETLPLRMKKHCENALAVAKYLEKNEKVAWVKYPGLESDPYHVLAEKYMPDGTCGVLCFGVKGDRATQLKFMDALKLASIVTHVADAQTCLLHPASHTHRQMTDEQLISAGVAPDLIRFSVGLEDEKDIIADLEQAFSQI